MKLKTFYGILAIIFALWVSNASADEDRYARLRYVDGDVTLYPVDNQRPNDATVNTPLADGDELQTRSGRAELAFRNGVVVRVGNDSAVRIISTYSPMTIELLQGTLFVDSHMVNSLRDELTIQAKIRRFTSLMKEICESILVRKERFVLPALRVSLKLAQMEKESYCKRENELI